MIHSRASWQTIALRCCAAVATITIPVAAYAIEVTEVHVFHHVPNSPDGAYPGPVIAAADGNIYGTTQEGGTFGAGTVFRIDKDGEFQTLYTFKGPDGSSPYSCLLPGADGGLYGVASLDFYAQTRLIFRIGATSEMRVMAVLRPAATKYDNFSALVKTDNGQLYEMRSDQDALQEPSFALIEQSASSSNAGALQLKRGTDHFGGLIFGLKPEADPNTPAPASHDNFVYCGSTIPAADGHFWGPAVQGHGMVRSASRIIKHGSSIPTRFGTPEDNLVSQALSRFAETDDGNMLAVTQAPPQSQDHFEIIAVSPAGEIIRRTPLSLSVDLNGKTGSVSAVSGLTRAGDGNFYGLAFQRAQPSAYVLYRLPALGPAEAVHTFRLSEEAPRTGGEALSRDSAGNLYATFMYGGNNGQGVIYKISLSRDKSKP